MRINPQIENNQEIPFRRVPVIVCALNRREPTVDRTGRVPAPAPSTGPGTGTGTTGTGPGTGTGTGGGVVVVVSGVRSRTSFS